jgi:nucleotide-binding universal stress UspA family protein
LWHFVHRNTSTDVSLHGECLPSSTCFAQNLRGVGGTPDARGRDMQQILVPTDFSAYGDAAVEYAAKLARSLDATVHLLHVVTIPVLSAGEISAVNASAFAQTAHRNAQVSLEALATGLRDRIEVAPVRVEIGDAREIIDLVAEQIGADMIVMGTHGRRGLSRWFMGSIAESVVRTAPCPVVTVHQDARYRARSSSSTAISSSTFTGFVR